MKKQSVILVVAVAALLAGILAYKFNTMRKTMAAMAAMVPPPSTVSAAEVRAESWPNTLSAIGSLTSFRGITVKTEVAGVIREVIAQSGQTVKAGDPLLRLDTSVEEAQLAGLQAQARLAEINLKRARELRAHGTNTPSDLDTAETSLASAQAAVAESAAVIAKKHLVAPFDGKLGIVSVYPGQFLTAGDAVVVLESADPIHLDLSLTQQDVPEIKEGMPVLLSVDAYPGRTFEGKITAISPRIENSTRSLGIRATFENKNDELRSGMFARAQIVKPTQENALVIPASAVVSNPYGETVYVVEGNVANQRFIKTGGTRGDLTQVLEGLKAGDHIVTSGQVKLRNGSPVHIDNATAPSSNPNPTPKES